MTHHARGATIGKRAYDATTGRFLARDPLGRAPLFFADNPYAYAGNNPVSNVDPSGQYRAAGHGAAVRESGAATNALMARVVARSGCGQACKKRVHSEWVSYHTGLAKGIAEQAAGYFKAQSKWLPGSILHSLAPFLSPGLILGLFATGALSVTSVLKTLGQVAISYAASSGNEALGALGEAVSYTYIAALMDIVIYDIVANAYLAVFQDEAGSDGKFWLNPDSIDGDFNRMRVVAYTMMGVALGLMLIWSAVFPEVSTIWVVESVAAICLIEVQLYDHAENFFDQEEMVFGYALSRH